MWGNNSTRNDVCSGLLTLTHRSWCRGVVDDPAATRRQWLREWKANGSKTAIYGPDECLGEPAVAAADQPETRPATPDSAAVADAPRPNPDRVPAAIPEPPDTIPVLERISPARPHPAQIVFVQTRPPAYVGDYVELTDAVAHVWRIPTGVSGSLVLFKLPDEVADGEAAVRVGRTRNGVDHFSAPLKFVATSGPSPLPPFAASMTYPVAPGQWTDLVVDADVEFEISRADRIDVEFSQGHRTIVTRPTGPDRVHVQVPRALSPGLIHVRTRTWIERKPSEWSVATDFDALEHLVAPSVTSIEAGPLRNLVWWAGDRSPAFASAKHGEALVLRGHFPVARAADLRIQLHGATPVVALSATDVEGGVRIELPKNV
jgi:hypothetical protein